MADFEAQVPDDISKRSAIAVSAEWDGNGTSYAATSHTRMSHALVLARLLTCTNEMQQP